MARPYRIPAPASPRLGQYFGKAADQVESLGKAGAAFEGNSIFPGAAVEQIIQRKAYPKIFFYDGII